MPHPLLHLIGEEVSDTSSVPSIEDVTDVTNRQPNEPYLTKPTTQVDLERRLAIENGDLDPEEDAGTPRDFKVEGNDTSAYIGVDPIYQNYAEETHQPLASDGGPEERIEERAYEYEDAPKSGVSAADEGHPADDAYPEGSTGSVGGPDVGTTIPDETYEQQEQRRQAEAAALGQS